MIKKIFKYTLFLLPFLFPILVHADTTVDTSQFFTVTGRKWSAGSLEFASNPAFNNDWLLNAYNVTGGIYTPPNTYDYIEFSYFEHNTSLFNPCNSSGKFTAEFNLLFTSATFNQYVSSVKWGNDSCSIQERNQDGTMKISCVASPSSNNYTDIFVYYNDIQGTATSSLYISRNIGITCGLNTDALINNNNANTQDIMNNQDKNTQAIIDSSASNTDKLIEENKKNFENCDSFLYTIQPSQLSTIGYLTSSGSILSGAISWRITDFIELNKDSTYILSLSQDAAATGPHYCIYNSNKEKISCTNYSGNRTFTITDASYIKVSVLTYGPRSTLSSDRVCTNVLKETEKTNKDILNNLDDDDTSGASSEASDFFSSFNTETFGLTSIITAPLNLIQSVLSSTCTDLQLPLPFLSNKYLTLPCMTSIYTQHFGTFFTIYQSITYGIIAYWVCVRIFNQVKDFKNPEHDEIEVMDL